MFFLMNVFYFRHPRYFSRGFWIRWRWRCYWSWYGHHASASVSRKTGIEREKCYRFLSISFHFVSPSLIRSFSHSLIRISIHTFSAHPSVCPSVRSSLLHPSIHPPIHLSVHLFSHPSIHGLYLSIISFFTCNLLDN